MNLISTCLSSSADQSGSFVAARFELLGVTGRGGMGTVYRALDRKSGAAVAIKVMHASPGDSAADAGSDASRFLREAQLLSRLQHRNIVRYVAHGIGNLDGGPQRPFLAMEWLDGESLAERITRQPLSEKESLSLLRTAARALAVAHGIGVVHRDIKPSNLFLRSGAVDDVVLLDFGIARQGLQSSMTRTGSLIGTPDYMAPEQARGEPLVGPAADIFSLGCVLYECLTGSSPFAAQHIAAVLAKILFGEPAPLRSILPDASAAMETLIERMLRKDPQERFLDAAALVDALHEPGSTEDTSPRPQTLASVMQRSEQQLVSVVMALAPGPSGSEQTLDMSQAKELQTSQQTLRTTLCPFGRAEWLADGSLVVLVTAGSSATDQATQAARCALLVSERWPGARVAVATGRGACASEGLVGEALDRAVRLLRSGGEASPPVSAGPPQAGAVVRPEEPRLDELTAGLLRGRFVLTVNAGHAALHSELGCDDETRLLLGRPTVCVGRDQELGTLELMLRSCIEESSPQGALVIAPPGIGKTRLRREFLRRVLAQHGDLYVLLGQTDPLSAQAPYAFLGQMVRRAAGIRDGERLSVQRERLRALVAAALPGGEQSNVTAFLGELASVPFEDAELTELRAARQDPGLLSERTERALADWLRSIAAHRPVLLVLEDLHWSDPASIALLQAALRELADVPVCVLALARPEALTTFPSLHEFLPQRIELRGLSKRASMRLVQHVLGTQTDAATVARIVEQAQGNALFLEELIRTIAEGKGDHLPETVMAMLQVRLSRLDTAARRALRAASVFGETFWRGGVASLLGDDLTAIESVLRRLVSCELVELRRDSRFPGEAEYSFHHALLGEAAYGLLTPDERAVGHQLAGDYLERVGELEPLVLASHFDRGAEPLRAGIYYLRAAEKAHRGGDRHGTLTCAQRALACGIQGEPQTTLLGLLCEAHAWYAEWEVARGYAQTVMRLSPPSSGPWSRAAVARFGHVLEPERLADFHEVYQTLAVSPPPEEALAEAGFVLMAALYILDTGGQFEPAQESLRLLAALTAQHPEHLMLRAWQRFTSAVHLTWQAGDLAAAQRQAASARDLFLEAGFRRGALLAQVIFGLSSWLLGDREAAERELRATLPGAPDLGPLTSLRSLVLCQVLSERGVLDEAASLAQKVCTAGQAQRLLPDVGRGQWALAEIALQRDDLAGAEAAARAALPLLGRLPPEQMAVQMLLAGILLRQGRSEEARRCAQQGMAHYAALPGAGLLRPRALLLFAESLRACGEQAESHQALLDARACVLDTARHIGDEGARARYLSCAPAVAEVLSLGEPLAPPRA